MARLLQKLVRATLKRYSKHSCAHFSELGIMIETSTSVMVSDLLAKEMDFLTVFTNDLPQYLLQI